MAARRPTRAPRTRKTAEPIALKVGEKGRVVIPVELRRRLKLRKGSELRVVYDEKSGGLVIMTRERALERMIGMYRDLFEGRPVSYEVIEEKDRR